MTGLSRGGPATLVARSVALLLALAALAALAGRPPDAHADADPPSDFLLSDPVYLPYPPTAVSPAPAAELIGVVKAARRAGLPLKVAVVASRADLGAVPQFFTRPRAYAPFLEREIAFNEAVPLLVVTPSGLGTAALPPGARRAATRLRPPAGPEPDRLAAAATAAVRALAAGQGLRIAASPPRRRLGRRWRAPAATTACRPPS